MAEFGFKQLEQLWRQAGGSAQLAPIMAAIALAESGGDSEALNDNPSTGDYSVGLWQINYYGSLYKGRAARWGPPDALRFGPQAPLKNAIAAVALARGGNGLGNWSTYSDGAYSAHLPAGTTLPPAPATSSSRARPDTAPGAGSAATSLLDSYITQPISFAQSAWDDVFGGGGLGGALDFMKAAVWLVDPRNWMRAVEFAVGVAAMLFGFVGVFVILMARTETGQAVSGTASAIPGPLGIGARIVSFAGRPKRAAQRETQRAVRSRTSSSPSPARAAQSASELGVARVRTEQERMKSIRARRRRDLEASRETRASREQRDRRMMFEGAIAAGTEQRRRERRRG